MTHDFMAFYDLYQDAIFRYCARRCRDRETAKDLMQDTFLRFWVCRQRNDEILHERAFLYRIAHNLIIDLARRKKEASLDQLLEDGYEPSVDLWHQTYSRLDSERIMRTLRTMKSPYRKVLHQRFIKEWSPAEIAHASGENANTISVRIFRGLKHLRGLLDEASIISPSLPLPL